MLFTSYGFMGFVLALLLAYYLVPRRFQWPLLLAASYLFYFIAGPDYLIYIGATTLTTYFAARAIGDNATRQSAYLQEHKGELSREEKRAYKDGQKRVRLRWLAACLLFNLAVLGLVKYAGFIMAWADGLLAALGRPGGLSFWTLAMPMGISFYTLQAIGYLVDVYRGTAPAEKNLFRLALFISFFPQLIQGPISRFEDLSKTLYGPHPFSGEAVSRGLQRMLWGYFKKMVIADRVLAAVAAIAGSPDTYQGAYVFAGALLYTLELYSDFTGGIDITIGLSQALGVTLQENFRQPYFSKSLKEYWRRWHISLGAWFRTYMFYPITICRPMQSFLKFSRKHFGERVGRRLPVYISSFVVWFATGVWHGVTWNFIVWGLSNWAVLMISEELEPLYERFHKRFPWADGKGYQIFQMLRTFLLICLLHVFDCYHSLSDTLRMMASMFTARNWSILWDGSLLELGLSGLDYGILAAGAAVMLLVSIAQQRGSIRERSAALPYPARFLLWYGLFLAVVLLGAYGIGYDASQFIYNQY